VEELGVLLWLEQSFDTARFREAWSTLEGGRVRGQVRDKIE